MKKIYLLKTLFTLTLFTLILNVNAQSESCSSILWRSWDYKEKAASKNTLPKRNN